MYKKKKLYKKKRVFDNITVYSGVENYLYIFVYQPSLSPQAHGCFKS